MWINNIFQVLSRVSSTRIMGRPIFSSVTIKVVVGAIPVAGAVKHWTIALTGGKLGGRRCSSALVGHSFNYLTAYTSFLPINQTSSSRMTNQPVVNIGLDQDLSSKLFPLREIHGIVMFHLVRELSRSGRPLLVSLTNLVLV